LSKSISIEGYKEVFNHHSKYQLIQVLENDLGRILALDGRIQVTTFDWHRYHECMAIVPYLFTPFAKDILILGGGDGYCAKVLLDNYNDYIKSITIVDIDKEVIQVSKAFFEFPSDKRIKVFNIDAWDFVKKWDGKFDLILADYTDPIFSYASNLFTVEHLSDIHDILSDKGVFCIQMIAPFINPKAASCLVSTVSYAFNDCYTMPYRVHMPMYPPPGQQGFCLASKQPMQLQVPQGLRFLNHLNIQSIFWLDNDECYEQVEPSTLDNLLYKQLFSLMFSRDIEEWEIQS
jgi:spermidine synthase